MKIGTKIGELRKKSGLSQETLAAKLDVSRQTISSWESDITSPDLESAAKLARVFEVSLDDLVNDGVAVECKNRGSKILSSLIGKEAYLDIDIDDYRVNFTTLCKIISIDDNFVKIEFKDGKETITKLVDLDLIYSFKVVKKKGRK